MTSTGPSLRYTEQALRSFFATTSLTPDDRFLLIDNDGTFNISGYEKLIEVRRNQTPLGFAQNANQYVELALKLKAHLFLMNNDLLFTPGWMDPLLPDTPEILSPLSNREVPYNFENFKTPVIMQLEDYLGKEKELENLAAHHRASTQGYMQVTILPFFCVKLSYAVMQAVGQFDQSFGKAGAEDYDYCLRAQLAGFSIKYALPSFILHFGGKASWSGVETRAEQEAREFEFKKQFAIKWGEDLFRMCLFEDRSYMAEGGKLWEFIKQGNHRAVVTELLGERKVQIKI